MEFDAIILAGGASRRLDGRDKAELEIGGRRLLDRAFDAVWGARRVIAVGPTRPSTGDIQWTRETPAGGGPVAALAAGVAVAQARTVVVLAVDLPFADHPTVKKVIASLGDRANQDGAIATDEGGRDQPLLAAYDLEALRSALSRVEHHDGASMRDLTNKLQLTRVPVGAAATDCDTWEDVEAARRSLGE